MTNVTNCPNCQTQFIVTDDQLSQYNGKVRCGHCLHVFDATKELVDINKIDDAEVVNVNNDIEAQATHHEIVEHSLITSESNKIADKALMTDSQASYFQNIDNQIQSKSRLNKWLMSLFATMLLVTAIFQSIYFWRSDISIYYPKLKPFLSHACEKFGCNIELPKKIEFIIIDDSDMQEDANYQGLIHFSSTLINQAGFIQTYPNIELTLTDIEDKAKLRRIFKPEEYLPKHTDIENGLPAGAEIKVNLALTTHGESVAGYRISVIY